MEISPLCGRRRRAPHQPSRNQSEEENPADDKEAVLKRRVRRLDHHGLAKEGGRGRQQPQSIKGSDLVYEMPLTLREAAFGTNKDVMIQQQGTPERVTVKIPKGMTTGKKLRLVGKGNPGPFGGPRGPAL